MKFRVKYNFNVILKPNWAIVLWPFVLFNAPRARVTERWFRHELQHCYQVQKLGRLRFYTTYLWLLMKHGYQDHPYEIEAREKENDPLTMREKKWFHDGVIRL